MMGIIKHFYFLLKDKSNNDGTYLASNVVIWGSLTALHEAGLSVFTIFICRVNEQVIIAWNNNSVSLNTMQLCASCIYHDIPWYIVVNCGRTW